MKNFHRGFAMLKFMPRFLYDTNITNLIMKKIYLSLIAIAFAINFSYAQNTFPSSGNVGIGTTSPGTQLVVVGNTEIVGQVRADLGSTGNSLILTGTGSNFQVGHDGTSNVQVFNSSGGGIQFNNDINSTTFLHINGNGNVGIGTRNPNHLLTLNNPSSGGTYLGLYQSYVDGNDWRNWTIGTNNQTFGDFAIMQSNAIGGNPLTAGTDRFYINPSGNVGIGTTAPDQLLSVAGTIHSKEVKVDMSGWPDYVFKPAYHLPTLNEVKTYIDQNHHLPEMPSAEQVAKDGLSLGEMNAKLLQKVEELTLYMIEKDKEIQQLKKQVSTLIKSKP